MAGTIADATDEREEEDNEIGESHVPVNTEPGQHKDCKPCHIERHNLGITPLRSERLRKLALKASYKFLGEMQALHSDSEQICRKNSRRFVPATG